MNLQRTKDSNGGLHLRLPQELCDHDCADGGQSHEYLCRLLHQTGFVDDVTGDDGANEAGAEEKGAAKAREPHFVAAGAHHLEGKGDSEIYTKYSISFIIGH